MAAHCRQPTAGRPLLFGACAFAGRPLRLRPVLLQTLDFLHEKLDKSRGCLVELGPVFSHILVCALAGSTHSVLAEQVANGERFKERCRGLD